MVRIAVVAILSALLANCSGSNRVADIVPEWANTQPRRPAALYAARLRENHNKRRKLRFKALLKSKGLNFNRCRTSIMPREAGYPGLLYKRIKDVDGTGTRARPSSAL
jgi:hypothetical protein